MTKNILILIKHFDIETMEILRAFKNRKLLKKFAKENGISFERRDIDFYTIEEIELEE